MRQIADSRRAKALTAQLLKAEALLAAQDNAADCCKKDQTGQIRLVGRSPKKSRGGPLPVEQASKSMRGLSISEKTAESARGPTTSRKMQALSNSISLTLVATISLVVGSGIIVAMWNIQFVSCFADEEPLLAT